MRHHQQFRDYVAHLHDVKTKGASNANTPAPPPRARHHMRDPNGFLGGWVAWQTALEAELQGGVDLALSEVAGTGEQLASSHFGAHGATGRRRQHDLRDEATGKGSYPLANIAGKFRGGRGNPQPFWATHDRRTQRHRPRTPSRGARANAFAAAPAVDLPAGPGRPSRYLGPPWPRLGF